MLVGTVFAARYPHLPWNLLELQKLHREGILLPPPNPFVLSHYELSRASRVQPYEPVPVNQPTRSRVRGRGSGGAEDSSSSSSSSSTSSHSSVEQRVLFSPIPQRPVLPHMVEVDVSPANVVLCPFPMSGSAFVTPVAIKEGKCA